jgi:hypothetical protein
VTCLQFIEDYWIRHVRPDLIEKIAKGIDKINSAIYKHWIGFNTKTWSSSVKMRPRLPICVKGCGLMKAEDRRFRQYLGGQHPRVSSTVSTEWTVLETG